MTHEFKTVKYFNMFRIKRPALLLQSQGAQPKGHGIYDVLRKQEIHLVFEIFRRK